MVTARLSLQDAKEKGWLLDGYPRSFEQAQALEELSVRPDIYIVLDVCFLYTHVGSALLVRSCLNFIESYQWQVS